MPPTDPQHTPLPPTETVHVAGEAVHPVKDRRSRPRISNVAAEPVSSKSSKLGDYLYGVWTPFAHLGLTGAVLGIFVWWISVTREDTRDHNKDVACQFCDGMKTLHEDMVGMRLDSKAQWQITGAMGDKAHKAADDRGVAINESIRNLAAELRAARIGRSAPASAPPTPPKDGGADEINADEDPK